MLAKVPSTEALIGLLAVLVAVELLQLAAGNRSSVKANWMVALDTGYPS